MPRPSQDSPVRALPQGVDVLIARAMECTSASKIRELLAEPPVSPSALAHSPAFDDDGRSTRVLHEDGQGRIMLLAWLPGRGSAIVSYGQSVNVFRVLRGVATEIRYEVNDSGSAIETSRDHFLPGSVVVCEVGEVHAILNDAAASEPLVTLLIQRPAPHLTTYRSAPAGDAS